MCFIEYLGYTCGHTSLPIKRTCPLTTQQHNYPCCSKAAAKPLLNNDMCPSCMRILHGRWIDILEDEHRFMHARGACNCEVRFPYLQQPRVIGRDVDAADEAGEPSSAVVNDTSASKDGDTDAVPSGSAATTLTPEKAPKQGKEFAFSPSASTFTPSYEGQSQGQGLQLQPYEPTSSPATQVYPGVSTGMPASTTGSNAPDTRPNRAGSDKGKQRNGKKSRSNSSSNNNNNGSNQPMVPYQSRPQGNNEESQSRRQQQQRGRRVSAPAKKNKLAPLFEERELKTATYTSASGAGGIRGTTDAGNGSVGDGGSTRRQLSSVAVRMHSLYGAEWIQDHAEFHRDGRCTCEIRFDKYVLKDEYAHVLRERRDAEMAAAGGAGDRSDDGGASASASAAAGHTSAGTTSQDNGSGNGNSNDNSNANKVVIVTSDRPTTNTAQPTALTSSQPQPVAAATTADPNTQTKDNTGPQWQYSQYPQAAPTPALNLPTWPNYQSARWGYSPYDTSDVNYTFHDSSTGANLYDRSARPVDMQTIWYDLSEIPIAGLPIGAGPEGTSHMPPFEECELYYPQPPADQRPASH